ncbi:hypothetical protein ACTFIZ_000486 [Dictyostelium cf. discoideum]
MECSESLELVDKFACGHILSRMFNVVMKHSICDLLEDGPKHYSEISKIIGFKDDSFCYRLMRYFVPRKLFNENQDGTFSKTPYSTEFSNNGTLKKLAKFHCNSFHTKLSQVLPETLELGENQGPSSLGLSSYWEQLGNNEIFKNEFNDGMIGYTTHILKFLKGKFDLSKFETVVDIGGAHGFLIGGLLDTFPNVNGINFDTEMFINSTNEKYQHPRLKHVSGDFFKSVPEADCYLMKLILRCFSDDKCREILKIISKSMKPNGKIIILDIILDSSNYLKFDTYLDILMMETVDGKQRSLCEWIKLFETSGFKIDKYESGSPNYLIISKE